MITRRSFLAAPALLALARHGKASPAAPDASSFPIGISPDRHHFVDAGGRPFLMHGDAAWSLIADLSREDALLYLEDRHRRGFNTLLVSLIERKFAHRAPANAAGEEPFLSHGDFAAPNPAYFDHAAWIAEQALARGMLLMMTPAYMGFGGGDQGWYGEMQEAGADALRNYGRFVGERFRDYPNIIWLHGGDYDPPDRGLVEALHAGLREGGSTVLASVHGAPDPIIPRYWEGASWLAFDTVYTYSDVHAQVLERARAAAGRMPVILLETAYENEHGATEETLRAAAYAALLGGACGQIFGNNPVWHFDGPGLYQTEIGWKEALDSRGARSMTHLKRFFDRIDWWTLRPVASGEPFRAVDAQRACFAASGDGSLAVAYVSAAQSVIADLRQGSVSAEWFDPSSGEIRSVTGIVAGEGGSVAFAPPSPANASGYRDWVLLVRSR